MTSNRKMQCIVLGAGDHSRVLIDTIKLQSLVEFEDWEIIGLTDINPSLHGRLIYGVPVVGDDSSIPSLKNQGAEYAIVGLGVKEGTKARERLYDLIGSVGLICPKVVHPKSVVFSEVSLGSGTVVLAGAIIGTGSKIGNNVTVNIGASVSHDCTLEDHSFISDGAHITGGVSIGRNAWIGAGATILPYISVGANSTIAAGAVVNRDVDPGVTVAGVPAKVLNRH